MRAAAWTVPVVSVAAAAPAFAGSTKNAVLSWDALAAKWGTGSDPRHVSWDLTLTNGTVAIASVTITFTYRRANRDAYAGTTFTIYSFSTEATVWTKDPVPASGTGTTRATTSNIPADKVTSIHTDFSGTDRSDGDVTASAVITYADGTTDTLTTAIVDFAQLPAHVH